MHRRSSEKTFIIAEAGVNHNGSLDMACALVDVAAAAGADAVKFQTFKATEVISRYAPKAYYQQLTTSAKESQLEMVQRLELSEADHRILINHAKTKKIEFLSTPFDLPSLRLLTDRFRLSTIKIPSGEITNGPFLLEIAKTGRNVIMSTGMNTLGEVEAALGVLAFGYTATIDQDPSLKAFASAFAFDVGQSALREYVSLLHCTTEYPAPYTEVNLRAMDTLANAFGLPVGLSDHTMGIHIPIAAVARGAKIIEKHFTLDRSLPGPDHAASLEPTELEEMVRSIREVEMALGDGVKRPTDSEMKNRDIVRKSLVAAKPILTGQVIDKGDIAIKRPGTGLSPMCYWDYIGVKSDLDYSVDEMLA
ncbi:MAG: N-acetylneuraminate synthase [Desulfomonilaceae bacterium]|jgi:N-acetylneuraminate synthase